jgi:hypothetical protein
MLNGCYPRRAKRGKGAQTHLAAALYGVASRQHLALDPLPLRPFGATAGDDRGALLFDVSAAVLAFWRDATLPSPLVGEGREGGTGANIGQVRAGTPLSISPPQGGRGQGGA